MREPKENQSPADIARTLLGATLAELLDETFRRMDLAEEEIAAAMARRPEHGTALHGAFRALCPTQALRGAGRALYRAHCRELLERVVAGDDLRPATTAELAALLSALSLEAPLDRPTTVLYWRVFTAIFPTEAAAIRHEVGAVAADDYEQARARRLEARLRRKLRVPSRRLSAASTRSEAA